MTNTVHQHLGPVVIVVAGSGSNLVEFVAIIVAAINRVTAEEVRVVFWAHVATAAPALITHTEVLYLPSLVATVLSAELSHRCIAVAGHVFYPLGKFLNGSRTHVSADVRLATQHFAEIQELVSTEGIVFDGSTPVVVLHLRTIFTWADSVHPVILVCETSSRPS